MGASISRHFDDVSPDYDIIAVIGQTGVGKTTFINTAAGSKIMRVGHGLCPAPIEIQHVVCSNAGHCGTPKVVFVDVPALDSVQKEEIVEKKLRQWLKHLASQKLRISAILYLYRITDIKFYDPPPRRLIQLKKLYQESKQEFPTRIMLVTTMWGEIRSMQVALDREEELRKYWSSIPGSIASPRLPIMRFEDSSESAWSIVSTLMADPPGAQQHVDGTQSHTMSVGRGETNMTDLQSPATNTQPWRRLMSQLGIMPMDEIPEVPPSPRQYSIDPYSLPEVLHSAHDRNRRFQPTGDTGTEESASTDYQHLGSIPECSPIPVRHEVVLYSLGDLSGPIPEMDASSQHMSIALRPEEHNSGASAY